MGAKRKSIAPLLLAGLGGVLVLGAAIWYELTITRQPVAEAALTPIAEDTFPEVPRVSLKDAKAAHDIGNAVFVDVRDAESYAQSHIKGALSIPYQDISIRLNELDKNAWIITYCT